MRVEIVIGDWSGDGHGKTRSYFFEVTHPQATTSLEMKKLIQQATKETQEKTGLDCPKDLFQEYQESYIRCASPHDAEELAQKMNSIGDCFEVYKDEVCVNGTEAFARYILYYAKFSLPELEFKEVKAADITLEGYGYGLVGF